MKVENIQKLWDLLWQEYRHRVIYASIYEEMITAAGGRIANDHIAFRSLRMNVETAEGIVNLGIEYLESFVNFLGYEVAGEYNFPETHLYARHYRHPQQEEFNLPKLFISELIVDDLLESTQKLIYETVSAVKPKLYFEPTTVENILLDGLRFFNRPWQAPKRCIVEEVNRVTQYGAWVLLHGFAVNHFTGYVNIQNTPQFPDIETTVVGLANLGVPMKADIEGNINCGLRQTATQAVTELVTVIDEKSGEEVQITWTYAYYEIAQRYMIEMDGKKELFDGFLGNNAQHLFEMTRVK
ncbi:MAG: DUF1338 domain-containing protein [Cyanomargarita calcarea GSE-NOS-MK-12-04C]|jgi:hypothetical protein|uniref:2-oxoadipate dioxygenase/decarboxylase n=1 Tax=Cyanomargarita calcarea GSE-NOS-MK-12-04C TaxID=2839659 RepID=A0A951USI1_9CYAN|nr:DUF1338 domain-containing protein [Cyanomargarita calcarea GSE-NOS-MK-12-04C]